MADGHTEESDGHTHLVEELRRVMGVVDPVPAYVLDAARGSYTWRTIDAELAELAYDSATDSEAALARSADARRLLTFESPGLSVEVEVTSGAPERRLVGQLVPPQRAEIEIRHSGGTLKVTADELGRFAAEGVAPGPVSLLCRVGDATEPRTVATDWLVI